MREAEYDSTGSLAPHVIHNCSAVVDPVIHPRKMDDDRRAGRQGKKGRQGTEFFEKAQAISLPGHTCPCYHSGVLLGGKGWGLGAGQQLLGTAFLDHHS